MGSTWVPPLVYRKGFLLNNKVHVLCQPEGNPSNQWGIFTLLIRRVSFQSTRYMFPINWKEIVPVKEATCLVDWKEAVHCCWPEGFPSSQPGLKTVHHRSIIFPSLRLLDPVVVHRAAATYMPWISQSRQAAVRDWWGLRWSDLSDSNVQPTLPTCHVSRVGTTLGLDTAYSWHNPVLILRPTVSTCWALVKPTNESTSNRTFLQSILCLFPSK
jgi:hypothetical protein